MTDWEAYIPGFNMSRHFVCYRDGQPIYACPHYYPLGGYIQEIEAFEGPWLRTSLTINPLKDEAYTDADWVGSVSEQRLTSGYCTFVVGNLATQRRKKQHVSTKSSVEAEF